LLKTQGGWENDETVEEAARREAMEEAGVKGDILVRDLYFAPYVLAFLRIVIGIYGERCAFGPQSM